MQVIIRADSSERLGIGHIKRTLVLAQKLRENGLVVSYACKVLKGSIIQTIEAHGFKVFTIYQNEVKELRRLVRKTKALALVLDHYEIDFKTEKALSQFVPVIAFDDVYKEHATAMVINPNIYAHKKFYDNKKPEYLCGKDYVQLRSEFLEKKEFFVKTKSVLVMFGGSDHKRLSNVYAQHLLSLGYEVTVLTSSANQHIGSLKKLDITLVIDSQNVADLIRSHEYVISASGSSVSEIIALCKPFINVVTAHNQKYVAKFLQEHVLSTEISSVYELSAELLQKNRLTYQENMKAIFAEYKADKIIRKMKTMLFANLALAPMQEEDLLDVFHLVNEEQVRINSLNSATITLHEHNKWFVKRIKEPFFYKVSKAGAFLGYVRFDNTEEGYIISIALTPALRSASYATPLVVAAFEKSALQEYIAYVKADNQSSLRTFYKAGCTLLRKGLFHKLYFKKEL